MAAFDLLSEEFLTFWNPLEAESAPNAERLTVACVAWARDSGLGGGDRTVATVYGSAGALTVAHLFPHATGPLQQALADHAAWAFETSDFVTPTDGAVRTCDIVHAVNRLARLTRSPCSWPDDADPLENALCDTLVRIRAHTSAVQYDRFARGQEIWLHQMLWETALRERAEHLGVNEYLAMRIGTASVYATIGVLGAAEDIDPAVRELADPAVQAAREAALLVAALDNDRYSHLRAAALGQGRCTFPGALRTDHAELTVADSMRAAVAIRDRVLAFYLMLRDQVTAGACEQLRRFFTGLDRTLAGNYALGAGALRYLVPGAPACRRTSLMPEGLSVAEPLPFPTVAWWWDWLRSSRSPAG